MLRQEIDRWNQLQYPPKKGGLVESFFFKLNHPRQPRAAWIRYTLYSPLAGEALFQVWGICFDQDQECVRSLKNTWPVSEVQYLSSPVELRGGGCLLANDHLAGRLSDEQGEMEWSLHLSNQGGPLLAFPSKWMYRLPFPKFKLTTPRSSALFTGSIVLDGEAWDIEEWIGMQGHNWGPTHALKYAWGFCNVFEGQPLGGTLFEGATAQIRLGSIKTPFVSLGVLQHRGRQYIPLNTRSLLAPPNIETHRWRFLWEGKDFSLEGELSSPLETTVTLDYYDPDGGHAYCVNSKLARARLYLREEGCEPVELLSPHFAALEVLYRENHDS